MELYLIVLIIYTGFRKYLLFDIMTVFYGVFKVFNWQ